MFLSHCLYGEVEMERVSLFIAVHVLRYLFSYVAGDLLVLSRESMQTSVKLESMR